MNEISMKAQFPGWEMHVIKNEVNWGELKERLNRGELNGAVVVGIDKNPWYKRDKVHTVIKIFQTMKMWFGSRYDRVPSETSKSMVKKHYPEGKKTLLNDKVFKKAELMHAFVLQGPFSQKNEDEANELKLKKEEQLKEIHYGFNFLSWPSKRNHKKILQTEIERLGDYEIKLGEKDKAVWVSESGSTGLRTKVWKLGTDDYSHLVVFVPPSEDAKLISDFSRTATIDEIELFKGGKSYKEVPKFYYLRGGFTPLFGNGSFIKWLRPIRDKMVRKSTARAFIDLSNNQTPIKNSKGHLQKMICSEFVTRILQSAEIAKKVRKDDEQETVLVQAKEKDAEWETVLKDPAKLREKIENDSEIQKNHLIMKAIPRATMPFQLAEYLMQKCESKQKRPLPLPKEYSADMIDMKAPTA